MGNLAGGNRTVWMVGFDLDLGIKWDGFAYVLGTGTFDSRVDGTWNSWAWPGSTTQGLIPTVSSL